jgi:hypothetical protein
LQKICLSVGQLIFKKTDDVSVGNVCDILDTAYSLPDAGYAFTDTAYSFPVAGYGFSDTDYTPSAAGYAFTDIK